MELPPASAMAGVPHTAGAETRPAKKTGEEIAETVHFRKALASRLPKALRPIRRRPKLLSVAEIAAQLVVGGALVRIAQHLVGLLNLFEFVLGVLFLADVRVILTRQFAVGALNFIGAGRLIYT